MSKVTLVSIAIGLGVVWLMYSSMQDITGYSCEVCVTYKGQTNCAKAKGASEEEAQRTAQDTACATISAGMTESIQCSNTPPDSVEWF